MTVLTLNQYIEKLQKYVTNNPKLGELPAYSLDMLGDLFPVSGVSGHAEVDDPESELPVIIYDGDEWAEGNENVFIIN